MKRERFPLKGGQGWTRLPREAVDSSSLELLDWTWSPATSSEGSCFEQVVEKDGAL